MELMIEEKNIVKVRKVIMRYFKDKVMTEHTSRKYDPILYKEIDNILKKDKLFNHSYQQKEVLNRYIYNFENELISKTYSDIFNPNIP